MDKLENFIRSNREDFDAAQPDLKVWAEIDRNLEQRRRPRRLPLWRNLMVAASVLLLIGLGTLVGLQLNPKASVRTLSDISLEHQELEQYYESQLQEKKALLASYQDSDPSVHKDLQQLEGFLAELETALQEAPKGSEEKIVNAMIENYQDRLEILELVLSKLQTQTSQPEKEKNNEEITL